MKRPFVIVFSALLIGCGPTKPPAPPPLQVGWSQLVHGYRDDPDGTHRVYGGKEIQVYLPTGSYVVHPDRIEAYHAIRDRPGAIVFKCRHEANGGGPILVTGVCRGTVSDGIERANRIAWYIHVESCEVRVLGSLR